MKPENNEYAFPRSGTGPGLTKVEFYAAIAMLGIYQSIEHEILHELFLGPNQMLKDRKAMYRVIAEHAFEQAEALRDIIEENI